MEKSKLDTQNPIEMIEKAQYEALHRLKVVMGSYYLNETQSEDYVRLYYKFNSDE